MANDQRESDLVLSANEYAYVLDKTKGLISCVVGPHKMSLSTSDALVVFDNKTKRFKETNYIADAIFTFAIAPDNWYIELKNPECEGKHPTPGTSNALPKLDIGNKVNLKGPQSFALYPGQIAKIICGHVLKEDEYLVVQICKNKVMNPFVPDEVYGNIGDLKIIKGTDVSFFIPETGIEVIPYNNTTYQRKAVMLENLEYCILIDSKGNKEYVYGPNVVFPKPNQEFITNPETKNYKFRAIELSELSGIYVKVIQEYTEKNVSHYVGEEMFITGKDTMIYYPRKEHSIIDYDGKILHHAIAIPKGEGRYILTRKTGNVKLVKGPAMYLPDPREEVVVRRVLTDKQCKLWYPNNIEVLTTNIEMKEESDYNETDFLESAPSLSYRKSCLTSVSYDTSSGISRKNRYSKPRTITIDNKYDGAVVINVWAGYAVNVVSKDGTNKIIKGPATYLMEYDETLAPFYGIDGPETVYLKLSNNIYKFMFDITSSDGFKSRLSLSLNINYDIEDDKELEIRNSVFSINHHQGFVNEYIISTIKMEARTNTIREIMENIQDIVDAAIPTPTNILYTGVVVENIIIDTFEVLDPAIKDVVDRYNTTMIESELELDQATREQEIKLQIKELEDELNLKEYNLKRLKMERDQKLLLEETENKRVVAEETSIIAEEAKQAELKLQKITQEIDAIELEMEKTHDNETLEYLKKKLEIDIKERNNYTQMIKSIIESISPDLIATMESKSNAELLQTLAEKMSPIAIANKEGVVDTTDRLLRGTPMEGFLSKLIDKNKLILEGDVNKNL